jgi:hypothetical protein
MYVFYNKNNLDIYALVKPNSTFFNPDMYKTTFVQHDARCKNLTSDDVEYILVDSTEYDYLSGFNINNHTSINPLTKEFQVSLNPKTAMDNKNLVYNIQDVKRDFTKEQIWQMYNMDYINTNLYNIVKSGVLKVDFVYLKDLQMKTRTNEVRWESFFTDPFLKEMGKDKLTLGRDIMKRGMYYPFTCVEYEGVLTVFDGQHRITTLKLLQFLGEIPDDYRVLCIFIPQSDEAYKDGNLSRQSDFPVITRQVFECKYGSDVINDELIKKKAIESVKERGGKFIDDFTYEIETTSISEIFFGIHAYPLWVRDLIYPIQDFVPPNPIITNEDLFNKWRKGEK